MAKGLTPYQLKKIAENVSFDVEDSMSKLKKTLSSTPPSTLKPTIVITYDDGYAEDYDAFLLHKEYNVPGSSYISKSYSKKGEITAVQKPHLTIEKMQEMHDWGWEFGSHGSRHISMGVNTLTQAVNVGDTRLYTTRAHRYADEEDINIQLEYNGEIEYLVVTGHNSDVNGRYVTLKEPVTKSWPHGESYTKMRLTDDELYEEVVGSKEYVESLGFPCRTLVYPYNAHWTKSRMWVGKHYIGARAYGKNSGLFDAGYGETDNFGINLPLPLNSFALFSYDGDSIVDGDPAIPPVLNEIVDKNGLGIFMMHTGLNMKMAGLEYLIQEANLRGIEITTLSKALHRFSNIKDDGDWYGPFNNTPEEMYKKSYFEVIPAQY